MRKLATFSTGYGAAVCLAVLLLPEKSHLPLSGLFLVMAIVAALLRGRAPDRMRRYVLLCCAGIAAGLLWTWSYRALYVDPVRQLDDKTIWLSGTVSDWVEERDYGASVEVRVQLESGRTVKTRLYVDRTYENLRPGDRIRTVAHCTHASHTAHGEEITYFTSKGILLTAVSYGTIEVERPEHVPVRYIPALLAEKLKQGIAASFSQDTAPFMTALATGDRNELSDAFTTGMRRTGLSHMVAVSGMHLVFLVSMLGLLLGREKRRTTVCCFLATILFAMMTGCTPSVMRAAIMIDMLLLAPLIGRERDSFTALSFALLILLIKNPYAVADVSLQLSFAAVLGILLFSRRIQRYLLSKLEWNTERHRVLSMVYHPIISFVISTVSATFGAMVMTMPLIAIHFGAVSILTPLANVVTLWAVSLIFGLGLIAGGVGAVVPAIGAVIALPAELLIRYLNWVIPAMARSSIASISLDSIYCRIWLVFLYGILALSFIAAGRKRLLIPLSATALTLTCALLFTALTFRAGELTVQVLDVGQGQSVLLRAGDSFVLTDCGGDGYVNAGDAAADSLQMAGCRSLDLLVLTHCHSDHANSVAQLMDRMNVKAIALPDIEEESDLRAEILSKARSAGVEVRSINKMTEIALSERTVLTLFPPFEEGEGANELGLTVLCSTGEYDVLITGDMGTEVERKLVESTQLPDVELMVAGHHGSKYANSQLLLDTVRPDAVVFSVGADNRYGHPASETIERFASIGAQIYRTDRMGAVTVHCN